MEHNTLSTKISAVDLRKYLSSTLDLVSDGERICITRHGKPVAALVPVEDYKISQDSAQISIEDFLEKPLTT